MDEAWFRLPTYRGGTGSFKLLLALCCIIGGIYGATGAITDSDLVSSCLSMALGDYFILFYLKVEGFGGGDGESWLGIEGEFQFCSELSWMPPPEFNDCRLEEAPPPIPNLTPPLGGTEMRPSSEI